MMLDVQKRIAADILNCSPKRVWMDPNRLEDIKDSITKNDIRGLINDGVIVKFPARGISRYHAKVRHEQRKKGKQRGHGSRKGPKTARTPGKETWMNKIRSQRKLLSEMKARGTIDRKVFRELYLKSKGGFFRSVRHIKLYMTEHNLSKKK